MKVLKWSIIGLLATIGVLAIIVFSVGIDKILVGFITPGHDFNEAVLPPPPDYNSLEYWAAHPDKSDWSDIRPEGVQTDTFLRQVDVFFIHPTTYYLGKYWNSPMESNTGTAKNTDFALANQASVFSDCRVYAPRYRQATVCVFVNREGKNEQAALDLAYQDIESAFNYFIENYNQGRPFILAGHSQGSYHGYLLLKNKIDGTPLADRLIAAYLLGTTDISNEVADHFKSVAVCDSPEQTNCLIVWSTYADSLKNSTEWGSEGCVSVNPLTWKRDGGFADRSKNKGYVKQTGKLTFKLFGKDTPNDIPIEPLLTPIKAHTYARIENGALLVEEQDVGGELMKGNYHGLDFQLFYMDIRENIPQRARALILKSD